MNRLIFFLITGLVATCLSSCKDRSQLIQFPEPGDIYIFEESGIYFPVRVEKIEGDSVFCYNSYYRFTDAIPKPEDLPEEEFNPDFRLIYERPELERLYNDGNIVEIYRK